MSVRPLRDEDQHIIAKEYAPRSSRASFPVPGAQSTEAPTYCLKVNAHWVGHVIGALMMMDQQDAWKDSSGAIEFARNEVRKLIASFEVCDDDSSGGSDMNCMPVGSIVLWASDNIPEGWLVCDGQELYLGDDYPELFSVIGDAFKFGAQFRTPDMRFTTAIGVNNEDDLPAIPYAPLGHNAGEVFHQLTVNEMPGHSHQGYQAASSGGVATSLLVDHNANRVDPVVFSGTTTSVGGNLPHNNMQPSLALYYIIRALPCESESETVMASFKLRQKPGNDCVLEQSLDGGTTWIEAFDYNACFGDMKDQITNIEDIVENIEGQVGEIGDGVSTGDTVNIWNIINEGNQILNQYNETYNNTVISITPDLVMGNTENGVTDIDRNEVLCYATRQLVDIVSDMAIEFFDNSESTVNLWSVVVAGALATVAVFATGGAALALLAALASTSVVSNALAAVISVIGKAPFQDLGAREAVACCMYNALKDQTPEYSLYANSLNGDCGFSFGSHASQLAGWMNDYLMEDKDLYLAWLKATEEAIPYVKLGLFECSCDDNCEVLFVQTDPNPAPTVSMTFNTVIGITYQIVVSGTFENSTINDYSRGEAFYNSTGPESNIWASHNNAEALIINGTDGATLLGGRPAYRSDHTYTFTLVGTGSPFTFRKTQGEGDGNNESGLTIEICEVE